jgi:cell division protein FtsX
MSVGATKLQTSDVRAALRRSDAVRRFAFVSPDQGLAQARRQSPDNTALRDADPSALPASFRVTLADKHRGAGFKADFEKRPGVDEVLETSPAFRLDLVPGADPAMLNDRYSTGAGVDEVVSNRGPLGR